MKGAMAVLSSPMMRAVTCTSIFPLNFWKPHCQDQCPHARFPRKCISLMRNLSVSPLSPNICDPISQPRQRRKGQRSRPSAAALADSACSLAATCVAISARVLSVIIKSNDVYVLSSDLNQVFIPQTCRSLMVASRKALKAL